MELCNFPLNPAQKTYQHVDHPLQSFSTKEFDRKIKILEKYKEITTNKYNVRLKIAASLL